MSNDDGARIVRLDAATLAFALENCETNIRMALAFVDPSSGHSISRETAEDVVEMVESFNKLRRALMEAS